MVNSQKIQVERKAKECLAKYLGITLQDFEKCLKDELATTFLMVWTVFEKEHFKGFCTNDKLDDFAKKMAKNHVFEFDDAFKHFYDRYQDSDNYRHLHHQQKHIKVDNALQIPIEQISAEDKWYFLAYVIYRFRNNIFHGNKGIKSWSQYSTEINYCIDIMISLIEGLKASQSN